MSEISWLRPDDSEKLNQIWKSILQNQPKGFLADWNEKTFRTQLEDGHGIAKINRDGDILAFLLFREMGDVIEILQLGTAPESQRKGHMKALFEDLFGWARGRELWLEVHHANLPAIRFYEELGFCAVGQRPRYYSDGAAAVLYSRKVS